MILGDDDALVLVPPAQRDERLDARQHDGGRAEEAGEGHIEIAPAHIGQAEAPAAVQAGGGLAGIGQPAGDGGQKGSVHFGLLLVELLAHGLQQRGHLRDAHGLEQVFVHADLNRALGVFKLAVAAEDDDVDARLNETGLLGQLQPGDAVHADVGDDEIDLLLLEQLKPLLAAGGGADDLKAAGKLLNDAAHEAQCGQLVVDDERVIHGRQPLSPMIYSVYHIQTENPAQYRNFRSVVQDIPGWEAEIGRWPKDQETERTDGRLWHLPR